MNREPKSQYLRLRITCTALAVLAALLLVVGAASAKVPSSEHDDLVAEVQAHIDHFTSVGNSGAATRWGTVLDRLEGEGGISDADLATWLAEAEANGWRRGKETLPKAIAALASQQDAPEAQDTPPPDLPPPEVQAVDPPVPDVQAQNEVQHRTASEIAASLRTVRDAFYSNTVIRSAVIALIEMVNANGRFNPKDLEKLRAPGPNKLSSISLSGSFRPYGLARDEAYAFLDNEIATKHVPPWLRSPNYQGPAFFLDQTDLPDYVTCDADAHACWWTDQGDDLWTDIKGWGPWDDLPDQMQSTLKGYDPTFKNRVPRSADLDTEAPGFFREQMLLGPLNETIWQPCNADCGDTITRATLGSARYEGNVTGFIHPNVAHSGDNPYGLLAPRIWFQLNLDASTMDAGISYKHFNPGDDPNGNGRRSTLDRWHDIDLSSPRFNEDGLMGQFYGDGAAIYGLVQRAKIIGQFRADKQ